MDYIVVQAGGKGSRLGYLTENKPKALVPVENLPMLFHLFRKYPEKRFIIIADYHKEVLRKYLAAFATVSYLVVNATGTGTAAGLRQAMELLPEREPFLLIWSDLILPDDWGVPEEYIQGIPERDYVGISTTFPCRWKFQNGVFQEERSTEYGVAGLFLFHDKKGFENVPESGELVRWMGEQKIPFVPWSVAHTKEYGILAEYEALKQEKCRPFNRITHSGDRLIKEPLDAQGKTLAKREIKWYQKAQDLQVQGLPRTYAMEPLTMEWINGKNIYEYSLTQTEKQKVLEKLVAALHALHASDSAPADAFSIHQAYFQKTMQRLRQIEDLVPFGRERYIRVNGRNCRNVFFYQELLEKRLNELRCDRFHFIHGDCTFSNLMLREDGSPVLIDPRGYFGETEYFGDTRYDWAKLYYSIVGNYDRFNLRDFRLSFTEDAVHLAISSNGWEDMEDEFFRLTAADREEIKLIHAVIWLSLTTYAWQDYDSICGAFYNGLWYLEEVL